MLKRTIVIGLILAWSGSAWAQTATATSPSAPSGGSNQAQVAPSGGTVAPNGSATPGVGQSKIGAPTEVEKQEQDKSAKDTQICKGC